MEYLTPTLVRAFEKNGLVLENVGADYKLPASLQSSDDKRVEEIITTAMDEMGVGDLFEMGIRTDTMTSHKHMNQIMDGYLVNVGKDCDKPFHEDTVADFVLFMNLIDMMHGEEEMWENEVIPPDPVLVAEVAVQASSTGYFCKDTCNKKQNALEVAADLCQQADTSPDGVAFAPAQTLRKGEAIKEFSVSVDGKGNEVKTAKKCRCIQCVDASLAKATDCIFSSYRINTGLAGGEIIGESFNGSFGTNLIHRVTGGEPDKLIKNGVHESDAKGWEGTTKPNTALIVLVAAMVTAQDFACWGGVPAACMAHYYMPLIALGGHFVGARAGIICSGSPFTAKFNTIRHRLMVQRFIMFVEKHGGFAGRKDCHCSFCTYARKHGFPLGEKVTEEQLDNLRRCVLMGDDFYAVFSPVSYLFDLFRDIFCGTVTTHEEKRWDEGEICKRRLTLDPSGAFTTRKHPARVMYKMKGPRGYDASNRMAAAISHACDANDDLVYNVMERIHKDLSEEYSTNDVDLELATGYKGTRQMRDFPSRTLVRMMHQPTPRDITKYEIDLQCILMCGRKYE